jgi:hypothetical protein
MSAAAEEFTPEERALMRRILLKLTGSPVVDEKPERVVRERPKARPEDFELVRKIRRRKGLR